MDYGLEFKLKYGLDYRLLMRYEHVNTTKEVEKILNYFYEVNTWSTFGLSKYFGLYRFCESKKPIIKRAEIFLKTQ